MAIFAPVLSYVAIHDMIVPGFKCGKLMQALLLVTALFLTREHVLAQGNFFSRESPAYPGNSSENQVFFGSDIRYQQKHAGTQLVRTNEDQLVITEMWFPLDRFQPDQVLVIPYFEVFLSQSPAGAGSLSPVFDSNLGSNHKMVFNGENLLVGGFAGFALAEPYLFDARRNDLLVEIRSMATSQLPFVPNFDAHDLSGQEAISLCGDLNNSTGALSTKSLVIVFQGYVVPEPRSMWFCWALCVIRFYSRSRYKVLAKLME